MVPLFPLSSVTDVVVILHRWPFVDSMGFHIEAFLDLIDRLGVGARVSFGNGGIPSRWETMVLIDGLDVIVDNL